ncbi:hypothetical protein LX36DRAFT_655886 [Colletotrichum falcatum]|nr:hypothetical protein LX36DRAFT_655886 [Colletotrichum falcatum]
MSICGRIPQRPSSGVAFVLGFASAPDDLPALAQHTTVNLHNQLKEFVFDRIYYPEFLMGIFLPLLAIACPPEGWWWHIDAGLVTKHPS